MDLNLRDKVILVTGASRGIGLAIAQTLAAEGAKIFLVARQEKDLAAASRLIPGSKFACADVTDPDACRKLVRDGLEKFGRLDGLVCNVGSGASVLPGQETPEEWQRILALNFFSTTNMVVAIQDELAKTAGSIVCISSICGQEILGAPLTYSAAKAALNHYVHGISYPLAAKKVRINAVAPGNILFEGSVWERKLREEPELVERVLSSSALKKLGAPEEIARSVAFLLSEASSFTTGTVLTVDGGQTRTS